MTCADQTMIRRASVRAEIAGRFSRAVAGLRRLFRPLIGRVEDLNGHMQRDVGLSDGRVSEQRMRRGLSDGQPLDHLRF